LELQLGSALLGFSVQKTPEGIISRCFLLSLFWFRAILSCVSEFLPLSVDNPYLYAGLKGDVMKMGISPNPPTEDHSSDLAEGAGESQPVSHPFYAQDQRTQVQNRRLRWLAAALALLTVVLVIIVLGQVRRVQQAQDLAQTIQSTAVSEENVRTTAQAEARTWQTEAEAAGSTIEALRAEVGNGKPTAGATEAVFEALHTEVEDAQATAGLEQQAQIALARHLTLQARYILDNLPEQSPSALLLAVESLRRYPERAADQLVADGLALLPRETTRITHELSVIAVALSPDGRWAVSGSYDGTARVWEVETGREIARMTHQMWVTAVAFSPDGRWIVSASDDGTIRVWEAATGREVSQMAYRGGVMAVAFSPDGQWVVSGSYDGTARVWEATTGREVGRVTHDEPVTAVAFSPDGQRVISGSADGVVLLWEVATGREVARMTQDGVVGTVAFSPDGQQVIAGSNNGIVLAWEAASGREVARMIHEYWKTALVLSPDGQWVISKGPGRIARVWEVKTGREIARLPHDDVVNAVAVSADGRWVVSGSHDRTARSWDMSSLHAPDVATMRQVYSTLILLSPVVFSGDGRWVAAAGCDKYEDSSCVSSWIRLWDSETFASTMNGREALRIMYEGVVSAVFLSADGRWLVAGHNIWTDSDTYIITSTLHVYDVEASVAAATGCEVAQMQAQPLVISLALSPDGRWVAAGNLDGLIEIWETATGDKAADVQMSIRGWSMGVSRLTFSPDGLWLAANSIYHWVSVWAIPSRREIVQIDDLEVQDMAFSPDGRKFVVGGCGEAIYHQGCVRGFVQVWDLEASPARKGAWMEPDKEVWAVDFSPDGRWVVAGSEDNTARVWEVDTGLEVARTTHGGTVHTVAFSPDGQWVVSGSGDGTVRVWEATTGRIVAETNYNSGGITFVTFGPDGRWVVSISGGKTMWIWRWQPEDMIHLACERLTRNLNREEWRQYLGDEPYRATCPNLPEDVDHE
jgi:WD40 repeat protein